MALVAGATPGVPHLGQIKSQHLTNIGYAKTIDNFWTDGRIFAIFFLNSSEFYQCYNRPIANTATCLSCA